LHPPFEGQNLIALGYNIVHKYPRRLPDEYSPQLRELIIKFLNKNPRKRPYMSEIMGKFPSKIIKIKRKHNKKKKKDNLKK
jgi:NIMA (never in mitosis gene a)-related kinase